MNRLSRTRRSAPLTALAGMGLVAVLSACSQVAALTPVGGDAITSVRNAVYDVLVQKEVDLLLAPQCTTATEGFTCSGTTIEGEAIEAKAGATAPYPLTITIGGSVIFEGEAEDVLQQALVEAP